MTSKKRYPWSCPRCKASGHFMHVTNATQTQLAQGFSLAHAQRSPECHAAGLAAQHILRTQAPAGLTPRERHVLISARIKRKLMADALREMRMVVPAPVERSGDAWDAWVAKVGMKRTGLRKQFKETRALRRGYAFT